MGDPNEEKNVPSTGQEFRSSFIQVDGPYRDDRAVYSNISIGGGVYNREKPADDDPPPISFWRQAQLSDIPKIERLITDYTIQAFGHFNLPYIIETSLLCLVQINEESEIILFFAFSKTCQLPAIPGSATADFLELYYGVPFVKIPGVYMARLLLWDERYDADTLRYILRSLFNSQQEVGLVLLVLPGRVPATDFIKSVFIQVNVTGVKNAENLQTIHMCHRESVVGKIYSRIAEGQDGIRDTFTIFNHYSEAIQHKYGHFSMKELIENLESRIVLYSEMKYRGRTRPAAITVLNNETNLELLNSNFETLPFYGFKKTDPKDIIQISGWQDMIVSPAPSQDNLDEEEGKKKDVPDEEKKTEEKKESRWAREARLAAEEIERRRRRLYTVEHYLSQLSLTQDELHEPDDPFHIADAKWNHIAEDNTHDVEEATTETKTVRKKGKKSGGRVKTEKKNVHDYRGPPNAFIVELILTHPDFGDRLGSTYLRALFDVYPGLDYCLITLPHAYPDFPLLKYFTRMSPREGKNFPHDVFVLHRSVVIGKPGVREGRPSDLPVLKHMVRTLQRGKAAMLNELRHAFSPDAPRWLRPFVFTLGDEIIGAAIIAEEDDVPSLMAHYEINRHTNARIYDREDFACLRVGLMSPIYQKFGPFFLREIMRLGDVGILFHPVFPFTEEKLSKNDEIPDGPELCPSLLVMEMVPVMPRPYLDVAFNVSPNFAGDTTEILEAAIKRITPFSLFMITPRITLIGKRMINLQIVVVGASETGIGFLQNLIYSPTSETTRYSNLTLITQAPLPHWAASPLIDAFRPFSGRYSRQFIAKLGLPIWVNIVIGSVETIDRENRVVTTTEDAKIPYDLLFLLPDDQFSKPYLYRESPGDRCKHYVFENPGVVSEETPGREDKVEDDEPVNVFYINSEMDIISALTRLARGMRLYSKYTIIVYGHKIDLYTCLSGLLSWGVPGENIVVVLDRIFTQDDNVFADYEVMKTMEKSMLDEGVTLYIGWTIRSWQIEDADHLSTWDAEPHIVNVTFWPQHGAKTIRRNGDSRTEEDGMARGPLSLNCMGLFCFSHKTIDKNLLNAIFEAGLVFDGRLVVDRLGGTNDPRIKAAGPITRLTRRIPHARDATLYCSIEHGYKMAERMRHIWDPVERDHVYLRSIPSPSRSKQEEELIRPNAADYGIEPPHRSKIANAISAALGPFIKYLSVHPSFFYPINISCNLPGGWYYYMTKSPGKMSPKMKVKEYRTGTCESGKGPYCRVSVGPGNLLSCICVLSQTPQPRRTLSELYGHHVETVGPLEGLNNLLTTLLRPTVIAQIVGRRTDHASIRDFEVLYSFPHRVLLTTTEKVLSNNGWKELTPGQILELRRQFLNSPQQKRLEDRLQTYLEAHGLQLEPGEIELYLKAILHYTPS